MIAYTMNDVISKGLRKAEKVYDLEKLSVIPINQRKDPSKEILLVSATGGKRVVSREEISELGYTYVDGKQIKLSKLSSSFSLFVVRPINELVRVVYIPSNRYVEHNNKKISGKYIIVADNGKISTCSKKVFHKLFRFLPDVRFDNILHKVLGYCDTSVKENKTKEEKNVSEYRIEAKVKGNVGLVGYLVEDIKTGETQSLTVSESVDLVKKGKVIGNVRVAKNKDGQEFLSGADIKSLQTLQS